MILTSNYIYMGFQGYGEQILENYIKIEFDYSTTKSIGSSFQVEN